MRAGRLRVCRGSPFGDTSAQHSTAMSAVHPSRRCGHLFVPPHRDVCRVPLLPLTLSAFGRFGPTVWTGKSDPTEWYRLFARFHRHQLRRLSISASLLSISQSPVLIINGALMLSPPSSLHHLHPPHAAQTTQEMAPRWQWRGLA